VTAETAAKQSIGNTLKESFFERPSGTPFKAEVGVEVDVEVEVGVKVEVEVEAEAEA